MKSRIFLLIIVIPVVLYFTGCGGPKIDLSYLSAHELFKLGKEEHDNKKYLKAIEKFQTIVYNFPGESMIDTAQYYLALSYFGNEDYELAQAEFNRLIVNYPLSVYFENGIFMRAVCFYESTPDHYGLDQSDLTIAIKHFEDFIIDYPESPLVEDAKSYLLLARTKFARKYYTSATIYDKIGAYAAAEIYFQKVIDEYTDTEFAPKATFGMANMEYKRHRYEEAKNKFSDFISVFPENELASEAKELIVLSAFKNCENLFEEGDLAKAREGFEVFKSEFPESDKIEKADKYLVKISQLEKEG